MTNNSQQINSFVATQEELLRFLEAYKEDLFYFDINPTQPPPSARQFNVTTFPAEIAQDILEQLHPNPDTLKMTPKAKAILDKLPTKPTGHIDCGINIHPLYGHGWPNVPPELAKVEWVRFPYTASPARFPSLDAAFQFFDPAIRAYKNLGTKTILVLTHETYGEAAGYTWNQMSSQRWQEFTNGFVAVVEKIVRHYGNQVDAYEIWNEGDAEIGNPAAVHFPPRDFAPLLDRVSKTIRQHAPSAKIILGGLMSGPSTSARYVSEVKAALGGRLPVDAIGVHPYGKGAPTDKSIFARFGSIRDDITAMVNVAPNIPLWLTEVGATGTHDPQYQDDAAQYMTLLFNYLRANWAKQAPVVIWFALSDAMHLEQKVNGLFTVDGQKKPFVYDAFFNQACK
jgi:hypothetical protein